MSVGIYKYRWGFINIGGDLQMLVEIYKCRWGFINIGGDLQMLVEIYKCRWGFINIGGDLRKCHHLMLFLVFMNFDTNGTPYVGGSGNETNMVVCCNISTTTGTTVVEKDEPRRPGP